MIKTKKKVIKKNMAKINILIISTFLILFNSNSFAETKEDCSKYNTETIVGSYDKWRCKSGKEPRKKFNFGFGKLKELNPFKKN